MLALTRKYCFGKKLVCSNRIHPGEGQACFTRSAVLRSTRSPVGSHLIFASFLIPSRRVTWRCPVAADSTEEKAEPAVIN